MPIIRTVCAHDCPDMCSLLAHVEDGRLVRIQGDPGQSFTAGFACGKVNRDMDLVYSPERLTTPLRRIGPGMTHWVRSFPAGSGSLPRMDRWRSWVTPTARTRD
jgi:anaerobic selenocysteine-containing dehydrogenase